MMSLAMFVDEMTILITCLSVSSVRLHFATPIVIQGSIVKLPLKTVGTV